jgi:hypothetical protein
MGGMKYRKLRIAWSVAWGVVAVLLVVLWVRSYWVCDNPVRSGKPSYGIVSLRGVLAIIGSDDLEVISPLIATTLVAMGLGFAVYALGK